MADRIQGDRSGNVLVEFDYNNIIVVDPNKTIDSQGNISERLVDHENLVMFVNLEAEVLPRTKLAIGGAPNDNIRTISVGKINFLKPTKDSYLSTGYYDELTGKGTTKFNGSNQTKEEYIPENNGNTGFVKQSVTNDGGKTLTAYDNGLLGITSINVRISSSFVPSVTIELEDVQGIALFQLGENSPYAAFFNLPYPPFYLTMKGYYGQAIKYQLNLVTFNARFDSTTGNYKISLEMKGYKFNILNEISMGYLLATPHMYSTRFDVTRPQNSGSGDVFVDQIVTERGNQKIHEVYSEYKSKKLISDDFPELTFQELIVRLQNFEKNIIETYPKTNVEPLTNIRNYKSDLDTFYKKVDGAEGSWFSKNLNQKPFFKKSGEKFYTFKDSLSNSRRLTALSELNSIVDTYNKKLSENPTLGKNGPDEIKKGITFKSMTGTCTFQGENSEVDLKKTYIEQTGIYNPTEEQLSVFLDSLRKQGIFIPIIYSNADDPQKKETMDQPFFFFDGNDRFNNVIRDIESEANKKLGEYEVSISKDLAKRIEDSNEGLGFRPSVRNLVAVIMAGAEAFIRLLDEVHTKAWDVKYDPVRKSAILNNTSSAPGSDTKDVVQNTIINSANQTILETPVYPWPQFFVETNDDKKGRFELKYIGDPSVVNLTQGYLYDKWPEVEFVEQYLKGLVQKFSPPQYQPATDNLGFTSLLNINAIEFPQSGLPYSNKEEIKFFYEIWERQYLTSHYTGLSRLNQAEKDELLRLLVEVESSNLIKSIGNSNPYLNSKLKNYAINADNYQDLLKTISNNGSGTSWQNYIRDIFITPYINSLTKDENSFSIINLGSLGKTPVNKISSEVLEKISKSQTTNEITLMELYPFTSESWVTKNLIGTSNGNLGNTVFNTTKTLKVYQPKNLFSNFTDLNDYGDNRPITNFSFLNPPAEPPSLGLITPNDYFYAERVPGNLLPTEGYCYFNGLKRTTSMLNTPYFVNSILKGVDNNRNKNKYPYTEAAYLFINSLPLISLREKYKGKSPSPIGPILPSAVGSTLTNLDDLDYMFASLKKFGAIHKLPYAWILKIGSLWYRYKVFKESNVDILSSVWTDFKYDKNFDPVNQNVGKTYKLAIDGNEKQIQLESNSNNLVLVQSGFYPGLINDFCNFYNGSDLYTGYTDIDIQKSIGSGLFLYSFAESEYIRGNATYSTWSVMLQSNVTKHNTSNCAPTTNNYDQGYYIVPSFGSKVNQVKVDLPNIETDLLGNKSVYNGSVRMLWAAPNYGYFNTTQIVKPDIDSYMNKITGSMVSADLPPFNLLGSNEYSKIEEIFSIFEKTVLDSFEEEFLNFSKPSSDFKVDNNQTISYNTSPVNTTDIYRNFQILFRTLMYVPPKGETESISSYFYTTIGTQYKNFTNVLSNFLNYDVIFRYGNPSNFNRRLFDSFLSTNSNSLVVVDPIPFKPYVKDSLPSNGGSQTLILSKQQYPNEWKALELYIGFSTIPELVYGDNGSYITDFFIDNNISFDVESISSLSPLIKIYATQKLKKSTLNNSEFKTLITDYLKTCDSIQNISLNGILSRLNKDLPNYQQVPEKTIQTAIDGQQSKVEAYESFKALNDKWIAGGDYTNKTLFEDILFLDRASRNIGDTLLLDVFDLQNIINENSLNMNMSVFTFISGLLIRNNFTVMNLPAYVNFYNVQNVDGVIGQKPEGSLTFADNMWGTFLNVDYRESSPKMVCFYVGKPSQYLDLPKGNFKFRDDGFDLRRSSDNPLIEDWTNKKDYATSNRCVGFNVDIGIRNQNIFHTFQVSQDNGKATSESINSTLNIANQTKGINSATQNVSLYNLYKQRSYQSQVTCFGNALIQPTMYFNLRHVPMFNGPYMITDVSHVITPGQFQTTFTGTRQGIFDLPSIDSYLQSINLNLLTELQSAIKNRKEETPSTKTDNITKGTAATQGTNGTSTASEPTSCNSLVRSNYLNDGYVNKTTATNTPKNIKDFVDAILLNTNNLVNVRAIIYAICYVETFKDTTFNGWDNNYASINLKREFGETSNYFLKTYSCVNSGDVSLPFANFENINDFIIFMASRLIENVGRITSSGLYKYYICNWPTSEDKPSSDYFESQKNNDIYVKIRESLRTALKSARTNGIDIGDDSVINLLISGTTTSAQNTNNPTNNQNTTNVSAPACPTPTISTIIPIRGLNNQATTVTISGACLYDILTIKVNGQICDNFTTINNNELTLTIPANLSGQIEIKTKHGTVTSTQTFRYFTTTNTPQVIGNIASPGSIPTVPTNNVRFIHNNPPDSGTIVGNSRKYYNILKSNNRYEVLYIDDPTFTNDKVISVTPYNSDNSPIQGFSVEDYQNVKLCNVNNMASGTYYFLLTYAPNGQANQPILRIISDTWTQ